MFYLHFWLTILLIVVFLIAWSFSRNIIAFFSAAVLLIILGGSLALDGGVDFPGTTRITENISGNPNLTDAEQLYDYTVSSTTDSFTVFLQWSSIAAGIFMAIWSFYLVFVAVMGSGRR